MGGFVSDKAAKVATDKAVPVGVVPFIHGTLDEPHHVSLAATCLHSLHGDGEHVLLDLLRHVGLLDHHLSSLIPPMTGYRGVFQQTD